jgi:hypothetical protein
MSDLKFEKIGEANSRAEADVIKGFLEAEGIDVELIEESSVSAYPVASARIQIFVLKEKSKQAFKLLSAFDDV